MNSILASFIGTTIGCACGLTAGVLLFATPNSKATIIKVGLTAWAILFPLIAAFLATGKAVLNF